MNISQMYIAAAIIALAVIAVLVFLLNKDKTRTRLTPLAGLAFVFVLAGIIFGGNRLIGYGLMGGGVILAIVDIVIKSKKGV
ncbi:MAG: hypothetical protein FJZ87_15625 [Chloroflexi bacterium]|nr:hypothetical protein [Chloroflexota bacterium]